MKIAVLLVFTAAVCCAASCESMASFTLPGTTITSAKIVSAGAFTPPPQASPNPPDPAVFKTLPGFCRITATLKPSSDSDIRIEVWLPAAGWNGKLQSVGNGGWAGIISYPALAAAVAAGYATASTDTGHVGANAKFVEGHPEKLIDFAYRSVHEMTVAAKAMLTAYYGYTPRRTYWNGCSTGGRQGLMEAQRYPGDYDGIVAGAPANYWSHLLPSAIWPAQAVHKDEASYIPASKYPLIHDAALAACDALDGVKDGLIGDPARCRFDPKVLECKGADGPSCLSSAQVEAARKIYAGPANPRTKAEIFPGLEPGSELGWGALAGPEPFGIALDYFRYVVFKDPSWDYRKLNFDADVALADKIDSGLTNAVNPNLKDYFVRDGKLLMYHGWNDQLIAPRNSINYYNSVVKAAGAAKTAESMRLFMTPGMMHCRGGEGPDRFDAVTLMDQWLETGKAPDQMVASHSTGAKVDRTRPLCPYPQVAAYKGSGSADEAANFVCKAP
jgi:feruloyl esterase